MRCITADDRLRMATHRPRWDTDGGCRVALPASPSGRANRGAHKPMSADPVRDRRPRVLFLTWRDRSHPEGGGSEMFVERMAQAMSDAGWEATVLCAAYPGGAREERVGSVRLVRRGGRYSVYLRAAMHVLRRRGRYDAIVDVQNGVPFWTPLLTSAPVIVLVHHVHKEQWPVVFGPARARLGWWLESASHPWSTAAPDTSPSPKRHGPELAGLGVDPAQVQVIYAATTSPASSMSAGRGRTRTAVRGDPRPAGPPQAGGARHRRPRIVEGALPDADTRRRRLGLLAGRPSRARRSARRRPCRAVPGVRRRCHQASPARSGLGEPDAVAEGRMGPGCGGGCRAGDAHGRLPCRRGERPNRWCTARPAFSPTTRLSSRSTWRSCWAIRAFATRWVRRPRRRARQFTWTATGEKFRVVVESAGSPAPAGASGPPAVPAAASDARRPS